MAAAWAWVQQQLVDPNGVEAAGCVADAVCKELSEFATDMDKNERLLSMIRAGRFEQSFVDAFEAQGFDAEGTDNESDAESSVNGMHQAASPTYVRSTGEAAPVTLEATTPPKPALGHLRPRCVVALITPTRDKCEILHAPLECVLPPRAWLPCRLDSIH